MERPRPGYETTLDRAGLALGAGGLACGALAVVLVLLGGERAPLALAGTFVAGSLLAALGITTVAGPVWAAMHVAGRRGPGHAALAGALCCLAVSVFAQTYGFGLLPMPGTDGLTLALRWVSALSTGTLLAGWAALVGVAMWRVAYRRAEPACDGGRWMRMPGRLRDSGLRGVAAPRANPDDEVRDGRRR